MSADYRLLIVDDEKKMVTALTRALDGAEVGPERTRRPIRIDTAGTGAEAMARLGRQPADAVVTDIRMPDGDGLWLLREIKSRYPATEVVLVTAYATVQSAVDAMKAGAADYLIKPFQVDELLLILHRLAERAELLAARDALTKTVRESAGLTTLIYGSTVMEQVMRRAFKVARADSTVLIRGENGTGKDLVARAIHFESERASGPFVKANCAAIPEGLIESDLFGHVKGAFTGATDRKPGRFELADGGTIFLDEVGDMPPSAQVKLLRVLQEREFEPVGSTETRRVDVRVIAATNRDLEEAIAAGRFRPDLFYRLNVVSIVIPPLRERREDIPLLARHFVEEKSCRLGLTSKQIGDGVLEALAAHAWPGNVRELENAIEHALVLGESDILEPEDLPTFVLGGPLATRNAEGDPDLVSLDGMTLDAMEDRMIERALRICQGNQTRAAEMLGITRRALMYRHEKRQSEE